MRKPETRTSEYDGRSGCTPPVAPTGGSSDLRWDEDGTLWIGAERSRAVAALIFDLGGTLDADGIPWHQRFETLLAQELPEVSIEDVSRAVAVGERALVEHRGAGNLDLAAMVGVCVDAQLSSLGLAGSLCGRRIVDRFVAETSARLASRRPLLERLGQRLPLALVSNGCGNTRRLVADADLEDLFEVVVDSTECGAWKPDPSILAPALAVLAVPAVSVAVVGDRIDRDVACARAAGAVSVWVRGAQRHESGATDSVVDAVIERVEDLDPGRCM